LAAEKKYVACILNQPANFGRTGYGAFSNLENYFGCYRKIAISH